MKLSQKYADFTAEVHISVPYIIANLVALQLDAATGTAVGNFLTAWNLTMGLYIDPATHLLAVGDTKNQYHDFHSYLEGVKKQLKANQNITLSSTDIATINIHVNAPHRTKVPKPTITPNNQVVKFNHLLVTIFSNNPNPPHEKEEKMPVDVRQIGRKIAVVSPSATPVPSDYHDLEDIGSTIYDLVFTVAQGGATGYLITWYISPTGEAGPMSDALKFQIIGMPS